MAVGFFSTFLMSLRSFFGDELGHISFLILGSIVSSFSSPQEVAKASMLKSFDNSVLAPSSTSSSSVSLSSLPNFFLGSLVRFPSLQLSEPSVSLLIVLKGFRNWRGHTCLLTVSSAGSGIHGQQNKQRDTQKL